MNRRVDAPLAFALVLCVAGFVVGGCGAGDADAPAVAVRWENLTVTPATGPTASATGVAELRDIVDEIVADLGGASG